MIRFVSVMSSRLLRDGFPIEVAWVDEDGQGESHLIRPWKRWLRRSRDVPERIPASAAVDGISLDRLMDTGEPVKEVARRAAEALFAPGVITVSQQHAYDWRMLDTLFRAGWRIATRPPADRRLRQDRSLLSAACTAPGED